MRRGGEGEILLKANREDVKTVQELMRHANSLVTMNLYAQALTDLKRKAQSRNCGHAARQTQWTNRAPLLLEQKGRTRESFNHVSY